MRGEVLRLTSALYCSANCQHLQPKHAKCDMRLFFRNVSNRSPDAEGELPCFPVSSAPYCQRYPICSRTYTVLYVTCWLMCC